MFQDFMMWLAVGADLKGEWKSGTCFLYDN
jgi:hypothetical protein